MFISVIASDNLVHYVNVDHIIEAIQETGGLLVRLSASSFTEGNSRATSFHIKDEPSKAKLLEAMGASKA